MTAPLIDLSVSLHCVDKVRPSVLYRNGVSMIMIPTDVRATLDLSGYYSLDLHMCK